MATKFLIYYYLSEGDCLYTEYEIYTPSGDKIGKSNKLLIASYFGVDVDKLEPFDALSNDAYNINGFKVTIGKIIPTRDDLAKELIKLKIAS